MPVGVDKYKKKENIVKAETGSCISAESKL